MVETTSRRGLITLVAGVLVLGAVVVALMVADDDDDESGPQLTVALSGTDLSGSSASGDIRSTPSGWRIDLDADLPRLDDGEYYQAWLRDADGTLVPIGTFNEGEDVILWAGVSPVDYPTLTVTRESADNDQESSGDRVLSGEIVPAD